MIDSKIQDQLTQALLSYEKVWVNEEKTILAKNILLDLVEKNRPDYYQFVIGT